MLRVSTVLAFVSLALASGSLAASGEAVSETPLHRAAATDDVATIKTLLSESVNIDARDGAGATALLVAVHGNRIGAAGALIEAGADVNAKDKIQDSPYLYAGARGHLDILKLTLANGADLKSTNRYGGTALIPAAERGHVATVRTLLRAGVAVDHVNRLHWTALLEAILLGDGGARHAQIVQLLLEAGADPELADGDGVTPLAHARQRGYTDIETLLRQHGATR